MNQLHMCVATAVTIVVRNCNWWNPIPVLQIVLEIVGTQRPSRLIVKDSKIVSWGVEKLNKISLEEGQNQSETMRYGYYHRVIVTVVADTVPFISPPPTEVIPCLCYYNFKVSVGVFVFSNLTKISLEDRSLGISVFYPSIPFPPSQKCGF